MEFREGIIEGKTMAQAKNGKPYCIFTVDGKKYTSFEDKVYQAFNVGQAVKIGGEQDGQYWNMKTMVLLDKPVQVVIPGIPGIPGEHIKQGSVPNDRTTTMYVSYAKDIFVAICGNTMEESQEDMENAINLVKQAKEAFE